MNIFFWLKLFGHDAVQNAIAHNLGKISPSGWAALGADFEAGQKACASGSKPALAGVIADILFGIR